LDVQRKDADAADLERLGYVQELLRDMGGFQSFAISFSVISILTGATQLYGYGLAHGGPLQMSAGWWLVALFTMTVALAMAELASAYPTAGALYHWATFLGGRRLGWFTACFNTVGQVAILAGIDYGLTQFLVAALGLPAEARVTLPLYTALLISHALPNHLGIRLVSRLNSLSAWYHIVVVALILLSLAARGFCQPLSFLGTLHTSDARPGYGFVVGLLLAQWTLTGYDASAHVSEETHHPRTTAPWGIFLAVAISVVMGSLMLVAVTLSIPDLPQAVALGDAALTEILRLRLGARLGGVITFGIAGAMWLCGLASMTSASRMVYAFARDGGLPLSRVWCRIGARHRTPAAAIWALAAVALLLAVSVAVYSAVVSVATIALYVSYGLPIAARLWARAHGGDRVRGPWHLGRLSTLNAGVALAWIVFITVVFVLPPNDKAGKVMLGALALLVGVWLAAARERFVGPKVSFATPGEAGASASAKEN
jgi:amino acid transporter